MTNAQPQPGDACPVDCGGHLEIYSSKRRGAMVVRYTHCYRCGAKPAENKIVVPGRDVPKRQRRKTVLKNVPTSDSSPAIAR